MYEKHFIVPQTIRKGKKSNQQSTITYSIEVNSDKISRDLPKVKTFQPHFARDWDLEVEVNEDAVKIIKIMMNFRKKNNFDDIAANALEGPLQIGTRLNFHRWSSYMYSDK